MSIEGPGLMRSAFLPTKTAYVSFSSLFIIIVAGRSTLVHWEITLLVEVDLELFIIIETTSIGNKGRYLVWSHV